MLGGKDLVVLVPMWPLSSTRCLCLRKGIIGKNPRAQESKGAFPRFRGKSKSHYFLSFLRRASGFYTWWEFWVSLSVCFPAPRTSLPYLPYHTLHFRSFASLGWTLPCWGSTWSPGSHSKWVILWGKRERLQSLKQKRCSFWCPE